MRRRPAPAAPLDAETREILLRVLDATKGRTVFDSLACVHCGGVHLRACPRVKSMRFGQNNRIAAIEFWAEGEWPKDGVIWPEQIYGAVRATADDSGAR